VAERVLVHINDMVRVGYLESAEGAVVKAGAPEATYIELVVFQ
jgi:hypothetical protein